jgi:hypothetical protein
MRIPFRIKRTIYTPNIPERSPIFSGEPMNRSSSTALQLIDIELTLSGVGTQEDVERLEALVMSLSYVEVNEKP